MLKKSCKGSLALAYLLQSIAEVDPHQDTTRSGILNRAIEKAESLSDAQWQEGSRGLRKLKNRLTEDIPVPTAMQMTVEERLEQPLAVVEENMMRALELTHLQTRFEMEILLYMYLQEIQRVDALRAGEKKQAQTADLSGPQMVERLVRILMLNRKADGEILSKIKKLLLEWEE